jgi:hypothetical protein
VFEWLVTHDTPECLVQKRVQNRVPNSETFRTSRAVVRCVSHQTVAILETSITFLHPPNFQHGSLDVANSC